MTTKSLQSFVAIISLMAPSFAQPVHAQQQTAASPKAHERLGSRPTKGGCGWLWIGERKGSATLAWGERLG